MAESLWAPFVPDGKRPWNLARVAHLHRRAAFAGTWAELQRDLKDGPERAVARFLAGTANLHPAPEFGATAALLFDAAVTQGEIGRLKAGWFYRFLFGPDPLREKLTLLWHDHFATANGKVAAADVLTFHHRLLFGAEPTAGARTRFEPLAPAKMVIALLSSPEAPLG